MAGAAATGLVHISEAADEYVKDLGQLFSPGQSARPHHASPPACAYPSLWKHLPCALCLTKPPVCASGPWKKEVQGPASQHYHLSV